MPIILTLNKSVQDLIRAKLESYIFSNPFLEATKKYQELYKKLFKGLLKQASVSKYLDNSEIPEVSSFIEDLEFESPKKVKTFKISLTKPPEKYIFLLSDIFSFNDGKIPNLEKVLLWFPDYLIKFQEFYQILMYGDGPLPIALRFFIAIMGVSAYGCDYLLNRLITHFIKNGGDIKWVQLGLDHCPKKLQKLSEINLILAFCPWKLKEEKFFSVNFRKKNIKSIIS